MDGDVLALDIAQDLVIGGGFAALIVLRLQTIDRNVIRKFGIEAQDARWAGKRW